MSLSLVTPPVNEPVSVAELKAHLGVHVDDDNDLIASFGVAAREYVEVFTRRLLIDQTWDYALAFPCGAITVPLSPVSAVSSITYLDSAGVLRTWSASEYRTSLPTGPWPQRAYIEPAHGKTYPSTYGVQDPVTVRFVAGYGSSGTSVPKSLLAAIKLLTEFWFRQGDGGKALTPTQIEERLLRPFQSY